MTSAVPPTASDLAVPVSRWSDDESSRATSRRTRRRLLRAAAELFDARGFHGAALSDILGAAGLTKGALYFHFSSKHALALALLEEVEVSWQRMVGEIAGRPLDPLWQLLVETDAYVARWAFDPLTRGISRALEDPDLAAERSRWLTSWERCTRERIEQARCAGVLRDDVDPCLAARFVTAVVAGHHGLSDDHADLRARTAELWDGMLPRLATPAWLAGWTASTWSRRPAPEAADYLRAREP